MRCNRQWIVVVALAVNLLGGGMVFAQTMPGAGAVPGKAGTAVEQGKAGMGTVPGKAALININTADEAQLTSLKGIGPTKAKAITQYRQAQAGVSFVSVALSPYPAKRVRRPRTAVP